MSRIDMLSVDRPARHGDRQPDQGIFQLIHEVYKIVHETIDGALTWEQLTSPELNYSIVRPLTKKLSKHNDGSMIYVLMVNRIRFLQVVEHDLAFQALNSTRANLCELLSMKLLRTFSESELESVSILTRPYSPFSGAPSEVWDSMSDDEKEDVEEEIGNALEMAIVSSSKHFLATPLAQRVIDAIHSGAIVYTSRSSRSIINDTYVSSNRKQRVADNQRRYSAVSTTPSGRSVHVTDGDGVYVYDAREAGWLDHTRLRVPKWRTMIEFINFAILTALFIWNLTASRSEKHFDHIHLPEILFVIYCLGFSLDELATTNENGWTIYFANTWNAFDIAFIGLFFVYLVLRIVGLATRREDTSALAFDLLSIGASILLPRLCFFFIKDNVLIISLKAMISDFIGFMAMAAVCFSGILFTLWTLGKETWTIRRIAWLMLQIWFGSSYLGFSEADSFHPTLGPIIMVVYAALSNTLLVTILISILSNRFAVINSNAREEHMFQKAIHTVEGVKADYIFSYPIPLNLIALVVITPLSWILDAHALHQVNVFAIRLVYFPVLFAISAYERWRQRPTGRGIQLSRGTSKKASTRTTSGGTMFESFLGASTQSTIRAVFQHGADVLQIEDSALETPGGRTDEEHGTEPLSRTKRQATSKASPLGKMMTTRVNLPSTQLDEEDATPASSEKVLEIADLRAEIKRIRQGMERMEELLSKATS